MGPLVITPGDPDGIGPELVWKSIRSGFFQKNKISAIFVGAAEPFKKMKAPIQHLDPSNPKGVIPKKYIPLLAAPSGLPGYQAGWSIDVATHMVLNKVAAAIVTGPIHKERLQAGGYIYPGHTEFLAHLCGSKSVTMMLANSVLRVSLVTTHMGIDQVSLSLNQASVCRAVQHTHAFLRNQLGIKKPRIAITALNPHAGEGGLFGSEETEIIQPAITELQSRGLSVDGPFSADTFFAKHVMTAPKKRFDAVVAMYHDQGLIPVKLIDFKKTVNITLGLPIIRTSVDHGVGFDIAGKGIADPSSFQAAVKLALLMSKKGNLK